MGSSTAFLLAILFIIIHVSIGADYDPQKYKVTNWFARTIGMCLRAEREEVNVY
jgi:hypothetical protein